MKKYVKPELFYESFELSQQIAACEFDSKNTNSDIYNCSFTWDNDPEWVVFVAGNGQCQAEGESGCYHGSTDGFSIFNS